MNNLDVEEVLKKLTEHLGEWDGSTRFFSEMSHEKFLKQQRALESELIHKRIPVHVLEENAIKLGLQGPIPRNNRRPTLTRFIVHRLTLKALERLPMYTTLPKKGG